MVPAAAGSPLLERSHIMVPEPRHSSPCQREAAHTWPSGRVTVMSWRVSGRMRDPCSWLKHSGNEHISNSCLSHGRAGMVGLWFLSNLPTWSLLCTPGSNYSWCWALSFACKEGDSMEGTAGTGRVQFVSRVKFLIPWGVRFRDLWLKRVTGGQKTKEKKSEGRKGRDQVSARSLTTWVLESSCLGSTSGALLFPCPVALGKSFNLSKSQLSHPLYQGKNLELLWGFPTVVH